MEKIECALKILCLLSLCDGHISQREINIIQQFNQSSSLPLSFNTTEFINQLRFLTPGDQLELFSWTALTFHQLSQASEQLDLLGYAIDLIYADHHLQPEEQTLIEALAHCFNIDLPTFFQTEQKRVA